MDDQINDDTMKNLKDLQAWKLNTLMKVVILWHIYVPNLQNYRSPQVFYKSNPLVHDLVITITKITMNNHPII